MYYVLVCNIRSNRNTHCHYTFLSHVSKYGPFTTRNAPLDFETCQSCCNLHMVLYTGPLVSTAPEVAMIES